MITAQFATSIKEIIRSRRNASARLSICVCFYASFSLGAFAGDVWNCKLSDQTIRCAFHTPEIGGSLLLANKMASAMALLKGAQCSVGAFDGTGETISIEPLILASVDIFEEYGCPISDTNTTTRQRVAETGHAHYSFNCKTVLFKFYARGFDTYIDGSQMHWDTLT